MDNLSKVDLHLHTTASDGSDTPTELLKKARDCGLDVISITDHDTLLGLLEALKSEKCGLKIITGIEFSTHANVAEGFDCHILGYGFEPDSEAILAAIEHGRQMRFAKLEARIAYLREKFGISLTDEEISELRSLNSVARPHLARALVKRSLAASIGEAIDKYLKGDNFPDDRIDSKEAIDAIHEAGGVAVYAHPLGGEREKRLTPCEVYERISTLKELGIDGIEAYYSRYDSSDEDVLLDIAKRLNLCVSAGSDYHGENKTVRLADLSNDGREVRLGQVTVINNVK